MSEVRVCSLHLALSVCNIVLEHYLHGLGSLSSVVGSVVGFYILSSRFCLSLVSVLYPR